MAALPRMTFNGRVNHLHPTLLERFKLTLTRTAEQPLLTRGLNLEGVTVSPYTPFPERRVFGVSAYSTLADADFYRQGPAIVSILARAAETLTWRDNDTVPAHGGIHTIHDWRPFSRREPQTLERTHPLPVETPWTVTRIHRPFSSNMSFLAAHPDGRGVKLYLYDWRTQDGRNRHIETRALTVMQSSADAYLALSQTFEGEFPRLCIIAGLEMSAQTCALLATKASQYDCTIPQTTPEDAPEAAAQLWKQSLVGRGNTMRTKGTRLYAEVSDSYTAYATPGRHGLTYDIRVAGQAWSTLGHQIASLQHLAVIETAFELLNPAAT